MKKYRKRIIGVGTFLIVITLLLSYSVSKVNAENVDYKETCTKEKAENHYRIQYDLDVEDPTKAKISVANGSVKIVGVTQGQDRIKTKDYLNKEITSSNPLTLEIDASGGGAEIILDLVVAKTDNICMSQDDYNTAEQNNETRGTYGASITINFPNLAATKFIGVDDNTQYDGLCKIIRDGVNYNNEIPEDIWKKYNKAGESYYKNIVEYCWNKKVPATYTDTQVLTMIKTAIKGYYSKYISNSTNELDPNTDFGKAFLASKGRAENQNKVDNTHYFANNSKEAIKLKYLKCDPNYTKEKASEYDYSANLQSYYTSSSTSESVTYKYNYTSGKTETVTKDNACKRVCEEAVDVEYGPPIASKAGLCFEYKVKVTSRVTCKTTVNIEEPSYPENKLCSPVPYCNNIPGYVHQGGPAEEYEECIQECDGGKYTNKCSTQCYKEAYSNGQNTQLALSITNSTSLNARKIAYGIPTSGYYTMTKQGVIGWESTDKTGYSYARYYIQNELNTTISDHNSGKYRPRENGFKRASYGNGNYCKDPCRWTGCGTNTYLNPDDANEDYEANLKAYEVAMTKCEAAATCTSETATFTISVNYDTKDKKGKTTVNKINFPYSTGKDSLSSKGSGNDGKNTFDNIDSTILSYEGCYKSKDANNLYMTEWGFPGTWINNKTGEISFKSTDDKGWYSEKDKFCIPLNAQSVNTKWWEWKVMNNNCQTMTDIKKELEGKEGTSNGYNIEAVANNFGYFGWNFNIKCFYALKNEVCNVNTKGCCDSSTKNGGQDGYTIRTVDRENLFPNSNDNQSSSKRREIGFNWTEKASILPTKNPNYLVNPVDLIRKIQANASTLHDEENIDYKFTLTKTELNSIREYNEKNAFGTWDHPKSFTDTSNGIVAYTSGFLRDASYTGRNSILGKPGVNNE